MTTLSDQVMTDLINNAVDRVERTLKTSLQLIEDGEQRGEMLLCVAAFCAHEAAHYIHEADPKVPISKVWLNVMSAVATEGMCQKIHQELKEAS